MWQQLTPADIARVKHQLLVTRTETLSRHAAELKILDTQQEEIEEFEARVAGFAEKYLRVAEEQSADEAVTAQYARKPETPEVPSRMRVEHRVSPNFGIPLRTARGY